MILGLKVCKVITGMRCSGSDCRHHSLSSLCHFSVWLPGHLALAPFQGYNGMGELYSVNMEWVQQAGRFRDRSCQGSKHSQGWGQDVSSIA